MEEYTRDSLRMYRRECGEKPRKKHGNRWFTLLIALLFLAAISFFVISKIDFNSKNAKKTIAEWRSNITEIFEKDTDVTETVDAVLAEQDESV